MICRGPGVVLPVKYRLAGHKVVAKRVPARAGHPATLDMTTSFRVFTRIGLQCARKIFWIDQFYPESCFGVVDRNKRELAMPAAILCVSAG